MEFEQEIMNRNPENFDIEIRLFNPSYKSKNKEKKKKFQCLCGNIHHKDLSCTVCGEYKRPEIMDVQMPDTKEYCTATHCQIWLNHLQGKDMVVISDQNLAKLIGRATVKCSVANIFQPNLIPSIKCDEIREWLKQFGITHLNKYVPSLHRLITRELGREIIPPQFTVEEERKILNEWNRVSDTYQKMYREMKQISKSKTNNPYYPICILFIVETLFEGDLRVLRLRDYINKQAFETMELRKKCWAATLDLLGGAGER